MQSYIAFGSVILLTQSCGLNFIYNKNHKYKKTTTFSHRLKIKLLARASNKTLALSQNTTLTKLKYNCLQKQANKKQHGVYSRVVFLIWSGKRDSDPRHLPWQGSALPLSYSRKYGGSNRARTYDPLLVRQMLSQLSYTPISC